MVESVKTTDRNRPLRPPHYASGRARYWSILRRWRGGEGCGEGGEDDGAWEGAQLAAFAA